MSFSLAIRSASKRSCCADLLEPGIELIEGGERGAARPRQVFRRTRPARKLGQSRPGFFVGTQKLTAIVAQPRIEVAGLASLADSPAEYFNIKWFFQLGQVGFLPLDLINMPGDRFASDFGLAGELSELLCQPADNHRLVGPKAERLGLVQVNWPGQVAQDAPCLMFGVLLKMLETNTVVARFFDRTQSLLERFDLRCRFQQRRSWVKLGQPSIDLFECGT